jgi:hypothetical protein
MELKFKNFTILEVEESDSSTDAFIRVITGRMTKNRYKSISRMCRNNSYSRHCGCEHDCCGCLCDQHMSFTYKNGVTTLILSRGYNY